MPCSPAARRARLVVLAVGRRAARGRTCASPPASAQPARLQRGQQDVALGAVARRGPPRRAPRRPRRRPRRAGRTPAARRRRSAGSASARRSARGSPATKPAAVAGHRRALGQRVEDHDVACGRRAAAREPGASPPNHSSRVGLVAGQHEVVLARQRRGALVEAPAARSRAGRVVGVVEPQERRAARSGVERVEVGQEAARRRAAAARRPRARRTARRARGPGSRASVTADAPRRRRPGRGGRSPPWSPASGRPRVSGSSATPKRRRTQRGDRRRAARAGPRPSGRSTAARSPRRSAARMNAGVSSRGSPMPKSISVDARARPASRLASSSADERVGAAAPSRTGFRRTAKRSSDRVGCARARRPSTCSSRAVGEARVARAEVDRVDAGERRTRRPASRPAWARSPGRRPRRSRAHERRCPRAPRPDGALRVDRQRRRAARTARAAAPRRPAGARARRVAVVDAAPTHASGMTLRGDPARDASSTDTTSRKVRPVELVLDAARPRRARRSRGAARWIALSASHGRARVPGGAVERPGRVDVAQAAGVHRVVGRLHHDRQVGGRAAPARAPAAA